MNAKSNSMNRNKDIYLFKEKMCVTPLPRPPKLGSLILLLVEVLKVTRKGHQKVI